MKDEGLRETLTRLKLTQADLARLLDVTPRSVNLWATGQRSVPGPVAAYLRLYELATGPIRDAELARLKEKEPMLKEGMYGIKFTGQAGSGIAALILESGRIYGADEAGVHYDGSYEYNETNGLIESKIKVTIPPGVETVQGVPPQPVEWAFSVNVSFPRQVEEIAVRVDTPVGPVNALIRFLRSLPE